SGRAGIDRKNWRRDAAGRALEDADLSGGASGREESAGGRRVLHRRRQDRSRGGGRARHRGVQRSALELALGGRACDRRNYLAAAPYIFRINGNASRRVEQIGGRGARGG